MISRITSVLKRRRKALVLAGVSGVLYFLGFCGYDQFYLSWICLVPVLWALNDATLSSREALLISWTFGAVTHLGAYTWLVGMLQKFGHMPLPLALLVYGALCLAQGSLLGVWGWLLHRVAIRRGLSILWAAPVLMVICEWLYPALFPSYLANSQYRFITFIQSLDLFGPLGLTFILVLASAVVHQTLAHALRRTEKLPVVGWATLAAMLTANLLYGVGAAANIDDTAAHSDKRFKVGVVQTNMGIYEKHKNPAEGLRRHREQSLEVERQGVDVILWPESGYNYAIREGTRNVKRRVMGPISTPLLFGGLRSSYGEDEREIFNTAFLANANGDLLGTYDKTYLLAFGEFMPLGDSIPLLYRLSPHTSRFTRGNHTRPLVLDDIDVRFGVLICYEDILPDFVRKVVAHNPDILVNLTNDAWFGDTNEPLIHLALAVFRAVEHRRYLIRSTNTGISAVIDAAGRIVAQTRVFDRDNLVEEVAALPGRTVYSRVGDIVGYACLLVLLWWLRSALANTLLWRPRRRRKKG